MKTILMKTLRVIAIVLMGLTAAFTLMGGAGTICVALAAERFGESMALIAPYKGLYIVFVLATLAVGVMGIRALTLLIKGRQGAYRAALVALISGAVVGVIHIVASRLIRGASMPVDAVVYTTLLTLIFFLILRIPAIWNEIGLESSVHDKNLPHNVAAITLMLMGLLVITVQYWAGPTHVFGGINYADAWHNQLAIVGWGMILLGLGLTVLPVMKRGWRQLEADLHMQQVRGISPRIPSDFSECLSVKIPGALRLLRSNRPINPYCLF
jgi:hypothetical protein